MDWIELNYGDDFCYCSPGPSIAIRRNKVASISDFLYFYFKFFFIFPVFFIKNMRVYEGQSTPKRQIAGAVMSPI